MNATNDRNRFSQFAFEQRGKASFSLRNFLNGALYGMGPGPVMFSPSRI